MPYLIAGVATLAFLLVGLNSATRISPSVAARVLRVMGGIMALAAAAMVSLRGRFDLALGLGGVALWLFGLRAPPRWWPFSNWGNAQPKPGATSKISAASLEMELDHDSGAMRGVVRAGIFAGRSLDDLAEADCLALHRQWLAADPEAARLLEPYLDRRFALWRAAEEADGDAGRDDAGQARTAKPMGMTEEQAREILGLEQGADGQAITQAHRRLMKKMHPDHGGTTDDAARLNQARDILMRRHL